MDHFGDHDFKLGEARYLRLHQYATIEAANAELASAPGRMIYVTATKTAYFGMPGRWYPVGGLTINTWGDSVATPADLVGLITTEGEVRVVFDDPLLGGRPNLFVYSGAEWRRVTDSRDTSAVRTSIAAGSTVAAGTALTVAGTPTAGTTVTGSDGYLGVDAAAFLATPGVAVYLNGVLLVKVTDVTWTSATSLTLPSIPLDAGDVITVISYFP